MFVRHQVLWSIIKYLNENVSQFDIDKKLTFSFPKVTLPEEALFGDWKKVKNISFFLNEFKEIKPNQWQLNVDPDQLFDFLCPTFIILFSTSWEYWQGYDNRKV